LKATTAWPTSSLFNVNPITITFTAGYGSTPSAVPEPIRNAIISLVGQYYENREGQADEGLILNALGEYRVWGF
jgi:uncharacterized phiE125 gp8 family phage protein